MRTIEIHEQPRIGFARTMVMTLHGIRYRLFRSSVTVMVIAVATAFLMNVVSEGVVTAGVSAATRDRLVEARALVYWTSRLTVAPSVEDVARRLAEGNPAALREMARLSGTRAESDMDALADEARNAVAYLDFFGGLDYSQARRLAHRERGTAIFDRLQSLERREEFEAALRTLRAVRFPGELAVFYSFLDRWPALRAAIDDIRGGTERAIRTAQQSLGGRDVLVALTDAQGEFGAALQKAGFEVSPDDAARLARLASDALAARSVAGTLSDTALIAAVAARLDLLPTDLDEATLWRFLEETSHAHWFIDRASEAGHPAGALEATLVSRLAAQERWNRRLLQAERVMSVETSARGFTGMGERMSWLLLASVVVCMVGIANAMLMAVTERFREIATLKCLGALDGTIMLMFTIEAALFGLVGGLAGTLLGTAIGMGRMTARFYGLLGGAIPWGEVAVAMGVSVALGVALAAVASVYPSLKAARLAPMEAMRIE